MSPGGGAVSEDFIGCLLHVLKRKSEDSEMEEMKGERKKMCLVDSTVTSHRI